MRDLKLENGLLFMEESDAYVIPAMNGDTDGVISFEEILSPYLRKEMTGDYEIVAKFIPVHMSLEDSYGIYVYSNESQVYISLQETLEGAVIKSGAVDFMEIENPPISASSSAIYLKIKKDGAVYEQLYSFDGTEYISCGKNILSSDGETKAGYQVSSFQGSQFYVKLSDAKIE